MLKQNERRDDRRSALGKRVFDHDVIDDLGRVEKLEKFAASFEFIASDATIRILQEKNDVNAVLETPVRHDLLKAAIIKISGSQEG